MKKVLIVGILLLSRLCYGQGSFSGQLVLINSSGHPLGGSTISTFSDSLCTIPVNTWANQALTIPSVGGQASFSTDGLGNFSFFAPPSTVFYRASGSIVSNSGCFPVILPVIINSTPVFSSVTVQDGSVSTPSYSWVNAVTSGWYRAGTNDFRYSVAGVDLIKFSSTSIGLGSNVVGFGTTPATNDTGISRVSAGLVAIGNGTTGDFSGILKLTAIQGIGLQHQVFTSSGTFTIPAGITQVKVIIVGAGGGGGGGSATGSGTGGGAGGAPIKWLTGLTPGNTITVTVGIGGVAGAASGNGGIGGSSSITSGTQTISSVTGNGGGPGFFSTTTTGQIGGGGGGQSGGDVTNGGAAGTNTWNNIVGAPGGSSVFGGGGIGNTPSGSGGNGLAPGAGGGGGAGAGGTGGIGANGIVIFEWVN